MPQKKNVYAVVPIKDVLFYINRKRSNVVKKRLGRNPLLFYGKNVNTTGPKIRSFVDNGCDCSSCGLPGAYFKIERSIHANQEYYLSLYGIRNGKEVEFTVDHTVARCLGGANSLENTSTMCFRCNNKKAQIENETVSALRLLTTKQLREN